MSRAGLLIPIVLSACGGLVGDVDASTADASAPDAAISDAAISDAASLDVVSPGCTPIQSGYSATASGGCSVSAAWSCDAQAFHITCNCDWPIGDSGEVDSLCMCDEIGVGGAYSPNPFCPTCDLGQAVAFCKYPH